MDGVEEEQTLQSDNSLQVMYGKHPLAISIPIVKKEVQDSPTLTKLEPVINGPPEESVIIGLPWVTNNRENTSSGTPLVVNNVEVIGNEHQVLLQGQGVILQEHEVLVPDTVVINSGGYFQLTEIFSCDICGEQFSTSGEVGEHLKSHFNCEICGKQCSSIAELSEHQKVHTSFELYECETCGKRFTSVPGIEAHISTRHTPTSYACDACGEAFSTQDNLFNHQQKHLQNSMYVSNKSFSRQEQHIVMGNAFIDSAQSHGHSSLKPYNCDSGEKDAEEVIIFDNLNT